LKKKQPQIELCYGHRKIALIEGIIGFRLKKKTDATLELFGLGLENTQRKPRTGKLKSLSQFYA